MPKSACKARNNFLQKKYALDPIKTLDSIVGNCTACTSTNISHNIYINQ